MEQGRLDQQNNLDSLPVSSISNVQDSFSSHFQSPSPCEETEAEYLKSDIYSKGS